MTNRAGTLASNLSGEMACESFRPTLLPPNPPIEVSGELFTKLMLPIKKEGHRLRRGGPLFCLLFVRSRGKIMLKVISVKMYSVLLEVQYVYRP